MTKWNHYFSEYKQLCSYWQKYKLNKNELKKLKWIKYKINEKICINI